MTEVQRKRIRQAFSDYMVLPPNLEPHLKHALDRVLRNPGSLIRPEIVLQMALGYGIAESAATDLAIALEYFHTASLLFDDLPSMDDAVERRGHACVHIEFGDSGAILAALALVNRAYALTWRALSAAHPERQSTVLTYVERNLGVGGLLNGQSMDLHYGTSAHDQSATEQIAMGKTVSLIRLTLVLPAMLGGASRIELQLLERIALYWGLSYQILDDLKDVLQSSSESGKTALRDLSLDRPSMALVMGIDGAFERLDRLIGLGDRMLRRLIAAKPNLVFLEKLRAVLGNEALQLTLQNCGQEVGWPA
jgi:geranylgeranyl diphosphate synthase, type II